MRRVTGRYERTAVAGEEVAAFVPCPLPPADPPLAMDDITPLLHQAEETLARLALASEMVPSIHWFIYAFVRKEAVLSSQIEGTQTTLMDLLTFEATAQVDVSDAAVAEVCNYLDALEYARDQISQEGGLPISMRLLNGAHRRLLKGVRGFDRQPGEVRRSQNWIGGTRPGNALYVPPPPHLLGEVLGAFDKYMHVADEMPSLIRAALLHVQFESIHPYLDGNGRIGRLLVTLLLEHWKLLPEPLLYLSLYFKRHRAEYYRLLNGVRTEGDWESWVAFFLDGVATTGEEAVATARELFAIVTRDRSRLLATPHATMMSVRLLELLPRHPVVTVRKVTELLGTTKPTAGKAVDVLVELGVLRETSGRQRDRTFGYAKYIERLRAGTDLETG